VHNFAGIERALWWDRGSVARILAGSDPTETDRASAAKPPATVAEIKAEIERVNAQELDATTK
jgi:hypothetical protein